VLGFVRWYNDEHHHSAIRFVTPNQRHKGEDLQILTQREEIYRQAKERHPNRWSGDIRNWSRPEVVWLNPERTRAVSEEKLKEAA